ncbi:MAG: amidohydrolase family protein, partial [Desulfosarcinaceae bacterium]
MTGARESDPGMPEARLTGDNGPWPMAPGKTRLRVGWLLDGLGGPVQRDVLVTLENRRIAAIKPFTSEEKQLPGVIDLSWATLLPPLIDAHVHLSFSASARPSQAKPEPGPDMDVLSSNLESHWQCGITAVRDAGDTFASALHFKQERLPDWPYPQIIKTPAWAWHAPGRYGRALGRALAPGDNLDEAFARMGPGVDHIKLINSGMNSLEQFGLQTPPQFDEDRLTAIRDLATEKQLPIMVHANGADAVSAALDAGCDSIEHGYFMGKRNMARMADNQVFWVPTVVPMAALASNEQLTQAQRDVARRTLDHQLDCNARAYSLGLPIAAGTDAGSPGVAHGPSLRQELKWLRRS